MKDRACADFCTCRPAAGRGLTLTHGAGGDCAHPLLVRIADAFCAAGLAVLRCDLRFRQQRRSGPPSPAQSAADRGGLKTALEVLRQIVGAEVYLGGHSYGGRQASMLAAEEPVLTRGLLLLSYPLHPPNKPDDRRTRHFAGWQTPATFVHGTSDPFGTIAEMRQAIAMIPARAQLLVVEGVGHDLGAGRFDPGEAVAALLAPDRPRG